MPEQRGQTVYGGLDGQERRRDVRRAKTIRFSDPGWELAEKPETERGIPEAKYVRGAPLDSAEGKNAVLSTEIVEAIRRIYRSTYIQSMLKRNEVLREKRVAEMEETIKLARVSQNLIQKQPFE